MSVAAISKPLFSPSDHLSLYSALERLGVRVETWSTGFVDVGAMERKTEFLKAPTDEQIGEFLAHDQEQIERVFAFRGVAGSADIFHATPSTPGLDALKEKFKAPHTHSKPEIRLIGSGEGIFTIYDGLYKYEVFVQAGDFLFLPAGIVHKFELTEADTIVALRIFLDKDGWVSIPAPGYA